MSVNNLTKIRVIYADTDAMGIVYHTNYIKWFEVGRNELMRQLGVAYTEMEKLGFNLPLTKGQLSLSFTGKIRSMFLQLKLK